MFAERDQCVGIAEELADIARRILRARFRRPMAVETKPDASPVSQIDLEVERAIREHLARVVPDHGVIGEELGPHQEDARLVWVVDPIDGTRSFVTGRPTFVTLIGLLLDGKPVHGVIDQPITEERWTGGVGLQTQLNGEPAIVRHCPDLAQAWVAATDPGMFKGPLAVGFGSIAGRARQTLWGGDGYLYGQLSSGWLDLVVIGYACRLNSVSSIALTKLDVLSGEATIPVCVAYEVDGRRLDTQPADAELLARVTPVYEHLPGWQEDISGIDRFADLPAAAQAYVRFVEERTGVRVGYIGTGPGRESTIVR